MSVMPTPDSNSSVMMWSQRRIAVSQVSGLGRQMGSELLVAAGLAHLRGGLAQAIAPSFLDAVGSYCGTTESRVMVAA